VDRLAAGSGNRFGYRSATGKRTGTGKTRKPGEPGPGEPGTGEWMNRVNGRVASSPQDCRFTLPVGIEPGVNRESCRFPVKVDREFPVHLPVGLERKPNRLPVQSSFAGRVGPEEHISCIYFSVKCVHLPVEIAGCRFILPVTFCRFAGCRLHQPAKTG